MDALNHLEITIKETDDTEDYFGTEPFTLNDAFYYRLFSFPKDMIAYNWIYAYCHRDSSLSIDEKAKELLNLFLEPLCDKVFFSDFDCIDKYIYQTIFTQLQQLLENHKLRYQKFPNTYSSEKYDLEIKIKRETQLLDDLKLIL